MSKIKTLASRVSWGAFSTIAVTGFQLVFMAVMARQTAKLAKYWGG